ncbi:MAG TPA: hypothetical protein VKU36_05890, partial [Candidatus Babeliales bacterium]|nr:hypothetical protein [Candidatus Babeliales bacterium]
MKKLFLMMILVMSVGHSQRIVACEYEKQIINNKKINTKELIEKKSSSVNEKKDNDLNLEKVEIFVDIDLDVKNLYYRDPNNFKLWKAHIKDAANKPYFINCTYSSPDWRTNRGGALELIEKNKLKNEKICVDGMREVKDDTESNKIISDWLFVHFDASFNEITQQFEDLKTDFTSIPSSLLVDASNNFKKKGDIVFAFTQKIDESDVEFQIKLATGTSDKNFTQLIETFGNNNPNILKNEQSNLAGAGIITVTD